MQPLCAKCMFDIALEYLSAEKTHLKEIRFTNFDESTVTIFEQVIASHSSLASIPDRLRRSAPSGEALRRRGKHRRALLVSRRHQKHIRIGWSLPAVLCSARRNFAGVLINAASEKTSLCGTLPLARSSVVTPHPPPK